MSTIIEGGEPPPYTYRLDKEFLVKWFGNELTAAKRITEFVDDNQIVGLSHTPRAALRNENGVPIDTFLLACRILNFWIALPQTCETICHADDRQNLPVAYVNKTEEFSEEFITGLAAKREKSSDAEAATTDPLAQVLGFIQLLTGPTEPRSDPNTAKTDKLVLDYLHQLVSRFEKIKLPIHEGPSNSNIPLEQLFVDLPVTVERDVMQRYRQLHDSTLEMVLIPRAEVERKEAEARQRSFLPDILAERKSVVMVGPPGCGKSTLLASEILKAARSNLGRLDAGKQRAKRSAKGPNKTTDVLPIALVCRELVNADLTSVESILRCHLEQFQFSESERKLLTERFVSLLRQGRAALFVDGLDEMPLDKERRAKLCHHVSTLATTSGVRYCATSRVVGFDAIKDAFADAVVTMVDLLGPPQIESYAKKWAIFDNRIDEKNLIRILSDRGPTDSLTRNILTLTLLVQFVQCTATEPNLPRRRVELFDRLFQLLINRRPPATGKRLTANEVRPQLEFIALSMRKSSDAVLDITDNECLKLIQQARDAEPNEWDLKERSCPAFLNALIDDTGLLHVVGTKLDERGYERRVLRFLHQSFQEYFAGQAVAHGPGSHPVDCHTRIAKLLAGTDGSSLSVSSRAIRSLAKGKRTEPIIAEKWHETISFAIASLIDRGNANHAVSVLLPKENDSADTKRAKAVLALRVLADEPNVSDEVAEEIVRAAVGQFRPEDGFDNNVNTQMDSALEAIRHSRFGDLLNKFLWSAFFSVRGDDQYRIGCSLSPCRPALSSEVRARAIREHLSTINSEDDQHKRAIAARHLVAAFYDEGLTSTSRFHFLSTEERHEIVDILVWRIATSSFQPEQFALTWALHWFIGAIVDKPINVPWLNDRQARTLRHHAEYLENDDCAMGFLALILTCQQGLETLFGAREWLYETADVWNGHVPQRTLGFPDLDSDRELVQLLLDRLHRSTSARGRRGLSLALVRLGIFHPEMDKPLTERFHDDLRSDYVRDKAWWYLANRRSPSSRDVLLRASQVPADVDRYLNWRGRLGLILDGGPDVLEPGLLANEQDRSAFAYALAGIADPCGRRVLERHTEHADPMVREVVSQALEKFKAWKAEGYFPNE